MPQFRVTLADGTKVIKEANSAEEARALVTEDIRQVNFFNNKNREVTGYLDNYLFDYDEGVPNIQGLRSELAQAETLEEREHVATKIVGSKGFTYNSKGEMALTHDGLRRLGLPVKYLRQPDGSRLPINTIIDARRFEGIGATFADFAGISGPIIGSLIAMAPPFKLFGAAKKLSKTLFSDKGSTRAANVLTAAAGSAAGKGVEEAVDYLQGYQKQSSGEVLGEVSGEFLLGGLGQGIGEGIGVLYANTLGKSAPKATNRLQREAAAGRDLQDLQKLDEDLNRLATRKEIEAAVKKYDYDKSGYQPGAIRLTPVAYVVSQAGLGKSLPGRFQQIMESILGNTRTRGNIKNLENQISRIVDDMQAKTNAYPAYYKDVLRSGISGEAKISIDKSITNKKAELDNLVFKTNKELEVALNNIAEDISQVGIYGDSIGQKQFGELLVENMDRARMAIDNTMGAAYRALDDKFNEAIGTTPTGRASVEQKKIATLLGIRLKTIRRKLDEELNAYGASFSQPGDLPKQALTDFDNELKRLETLVRNPKALKFSNIIDLNKRLRKYKYTDLSRGPVNKMYQTMANELGFDRYIVSAEDGIPKPIIDDPIFGIGRDGGFFDDLANPNKYGIVRDMDGQIIDPRPLSPRKAQRIATLTDELRELNKEYAQKNSFFDNVKIKKLQLESKLGAPNADAVYDDIFIRGQYKDLRDIFANMREYDQYTKNISQKVANVTPTNVEAETKFIMQQQFFKDAFKESLDSTTNTIRFNDFGKFMKDFQRNDSRKLEELFGTQNAANIQNLADDLVKINPKIKSDEILDLLPMISKNRSGYAGLGTAGEDFLSALKTKAEAQASKEAFEANKFISERLPDATAEEVVSKVFTPRGADNIEKIKKLISPDAFLEIQNASMDKLLRTGIKPGTKGEVTDIFKPQALSSALDSYGDETLTAMFGVETKRSLRHLANTLDVLTKGEAGRGAAAGGLIAASLAVGFLNVNAIPLAFGIILLRGALSNPTLVRMMASTDKNSIQTVFDYFDRGIRQYLTREVARGVDAVNETVRSEVADLTNTEQARQLINTGVRATQSVDMPIPDLSSYGIPQTDPTSVLDREAQLGFGPILSP
jgi:hypothetical protein